MKKSKFFEPLAVSVAAGNTIKASAELVRCAEHTAYGISADPEFRQRVNVLRTEITNQAVGKLSDAAAQAVDTLRELLNVANDPPVRLQAAKAILAALPGLAEFGELRERLDAIEASPRLRIAE